MALHAIDPSIAMCCRRQQGIERVQVAYFTESAVLQAQAARCPPKSFIHRYLGERDADIDVLAGNDEIIALNRQIDDANSGGAPVEIARAKHIHPTRGL